MPRYAAAIAALLLTMTLSSVLGGCSATEKPAPVDPESLPHTHGSLPAGDGVRRSYVGYSIEDLRLPASAGVPGRLSFRIGTWRGTTQTEFQDDLTKKMHVYVVRDDLAVFRHVHPEMDADGTWTDNLTLPTAGRYRVITEFVAPDEGGNGDHLVLGARRMVDHPVAAVPAPPPTDAVTVDGITLEVTSSLSTGAQGRMEVALSRDGRPVPLGTYLGVYGHATAIDTRSGVVVHMHPIGPPETTAAGSQLTFHTAFETPGTYRLFLQVRIDGIVRTLPVTVAVA